MNENKVMSMAVLLELPVMGIKDTKQLLGGTNSDRNKNRNIQACMKLCHPLKVKFDKTVCANK